MKVPLSGVHRRSTEIRSALSRSSISAGSLAVLCGLSSACAQVATIELLPLVQPFQYPMVAQSVSVDGQTVVGIMKGPTWSPAATDPHDIIEIHNFAGWRWTRQQGMTLLPGLGGPVFIHSAYGQAVMGTPIVGRLGRQGETEACRWNTLTGAPVGLGWLPGATGPLQGRAIGVSANGAIVAGWSSNSAGNIEGFRHSQSLGGMTGIGVLPGLVASYPTALSADGTVIVGYSPGNPYEVGFRWNPMENMQPLGWLPGGTAFSCARGVNANGSVIVGEVGAIAEGVTRPFVWRVGSGMEGLPALSTQHNVNVARAVSADGQTVVGESYTLSGSAISSRTATIWTASGGLRTLASELALQGAAIPAGHTLAAATAISPNGQVIVGWAQASNGHAVAFRTVLGGTALPPFPGPPPGPTSLTYHTDELPAPGPGINRLIVCIHGWRDSPAMWHGITEFDAFLESYRQSLLPATPLANWHEWYYDWSEDAASANFFTARAHTPGHGQNLFYQIITRGNGVYNHVHLISHSLGAPINEGVARRLAVRGIPVQQTFLDPAAQAPNQALFGATSSVAESYYSPGIIPYTGHIFLHALNVDVRRVAAPDIALDPFANHRWPHIWYTWTMEGMGSYTPVSEYGMVGWGLSRELAQVNNLVWPPPNYSGRKIQVLKKYGVFDWSANLPIPQEPARHARIYEVARNGIVQIVTAPDPTGLGESAIQITLDTISAQASSWCAMAIDTLPGARPINGFLMRIRYPGRTPGKGVLQVFIANPQGTEWIPVQSIYEEFNLDGTAYQQYEPATFPEDLPPGKHLICFAYTSQDGLPSTIEVSNFGAAYFGPACEPTIVDQPDHTQGYLGRGAALRVTAIAGDGGGSSTFQWRRNGVALSNGPAPGGGSIAGSQTPSLSFSSLGAADAGTYDCVVTNACGSATTLERDLTVSCYGNCDGSTGTPALTPNDFQCFLNLYAAADEYANCDQSTGNPLLTPNDFQCFLNSYAAGCP